MPSTLKCIFIFVPIPEEICKKQHTKKIWISRDKETFKIQQVFFIFLF